jgi:hypothetical protein
MIAYFKVILIVDLTNITVLIILEWRMNGLNILKKYLRDLLFELFISEVSKSFFLIVVVLLVEIPAYTALPGDDRPTLRRMYGSSYPSSVTTAMGDENCT